MDESVTSNWVLATRGRCAQCDAAIVPGAERWRWGTVTLGMYCSEECCHASEVLEELTEPKPFEDVFDGGDYNPQPKPGDRGW